MYAMAEIDPGRFRGSFGGDDVEFCSALLREENVVALPGACFGAPGYVRVAFCAPAPVLEEAAARLKAFCLRHASPSGG
jgi:tyrosine aminotransferase